MADLTAKRTTVTFYSDVPLKPPHSGANDTFYFESVNAQKTYFATRAKFTISGNSYQNIYKGVFRAKVTETMWSQYGLNKMNYMSFVNENFENKTYYAFITSINVIANGTLEVNYRIDNIQTWWEEFKRQQCYVERCHANLDTAGYNIQPEPCDPGTLKVVQTVSKEWEQKSATDGKFVMLIATGYDPESTDNQWVTSISAGMPTAVKYIPFSINILDKKITRADGVSTSTLSDWITKITGEAKWDAVISATVIPWELYETGVRAPSIEWKPEVTMQSGELDGYTPRNKKLYTAPYNVLELKNGLGTSITLRSEFFTDNTENDQSFYIYYVTNPTMTAYCVPAFYNGELFSYDNMLTMSSWPSASIATDAFKAYVAQNTGNFVATEAGVIGGAVTNLVTNPLAGIVNLLGNAINTAGTFYDVHNKPPVISGSQGDGCALIQGIQHFYVEHKCVRNEYARKIDSFFQMFGYAQNQVMTPPIHNRKKWTYVKTAGCIITGNIPAEANADIASIFDSGVRFWADTVKFGQFDQDNDPLLG